MVKGDNGNIFGLWVHTHISNHPYLVIDAYSCDMFACCSVLVKLLLVLSIFDQSFFANVQSLV